CPPKGHPAANWAGGLGDEAAAAVDEHVFGCDACTAETERLAGLVGALREKIPFVISHAHRDRLVAAGTRIHGTPLEPTPARAAKTSARFPPPRDALLFPLPP